MRVVNVSGPWAAVFLLAGAAFSAPGNSLDYGKIALSFEPNRGQAPAAVEYLARGTGYTIALQRDGVSLDLRATQSNGKKQVVAVRFLGGAAKPPVAAEPLAGTVNYFLGSKPSGWHTGIPTFGRVEYRGLYPGINAIYYGTQGNLEYDFAIAPGADPSRVRLGITGTGSVTIDANGDLALSSGANALLQKRPAAYQMDPRGNREAVDANYVRLNGGAIGFQLGKYDHGRELRIDPVLAYATFLGGSGSDGVAGIQIDGSGNAYITGFTTSTNFPLAGAIQKAYKGSTQGGNGLSSFGDAFVAKLNPAGTALAFATYLGGSDDDIGISVTFDITGNVYVAGNTRSADFPTTAGAFQTKFGGTVQADFYDAGDAFIAKLNPTGSQLLYSTYLGGSQNEMAWGIAVDANGIATVAGSTQSTDFPTKNAAYAKFLGAQGFGDIAGGDAFIARLDAAGATLLYSTYFGGSGQDAIKALATDSQGNAYVGGFTYSPDFPTTPGAFQTKFHGSLGSNSTPSSDDAFVAKFSSQGALVYSTYLGGSARDWVWGLAVDSTGNVIVTGGTLSTDFPVTSGAVQARFGGTGAVGQPDDITIGDGFVAKLNPSGTALVYATYLGGAGDEVAAAVTADPSGNAFVTGFTLSRDFPVSMDALQPQMAGFGGQGGTGLAADGSGNINTGDAFLTKLSPSGALMYSSYYGGTGDDFAMAIALDPAGSAYIVGATVSQTLHTSAGAVQGTYGGTGPLFPRGDGFVTKFDFGGTLAPVPASISFISGLTTSGNVNSTLNVTAQVLDSNSKPVSGATVSFTATNATVNPASATTDANGQASTAVTLGSTAGTGTVTATAGSLTPAKLNLTINAAVPSPSITGALNGATFLAQNAPGEWISFFIKDLDVPRADGTQVPLATTLGGVTVKVNGSAIPLDLVYPLDSATTQINAQLPYETPLGTVSATVETSASVSAPFQFSVQASAPGVFVFGNNRAVVQNVNLDGSLTVNTSDNPIPAGGTIVAYLTGQGQLDHPVPTGAVAPSSPLSRPALPYSATIGTEDAPVQFMGLTPGQIGLLQANLTVPADLKPGDYSLVVTIGGSPSNGPMISVTKPRS